MNNKLLDCVWACVRVCCELAMGLMAMGAVLWMVAFTVLLVCYLDYPKWRHRVIYFPMPAAIGFAPQDFQPASTNSFELNLLPSNPKIL